MEKKTKKEEHYLRYDFTHEELFEKGAKLARYNEELNSLDNSRKAVASDFKAKIDAKKATIEVLVNQMTNGYEYRNIPCTEYLNEPQTGMKTIVRDDTNEIVKTEAMTMDEMQLELDLRDDEAEQPDPFENAGRPEPPEYFENNVPREEPNAPIRKMVPTPVPPPANDPE